MAFVKAGIDCHNLNNNHSIREHNKLSEQRSQSGFKTSTNNDATYEKAMPLEKLQFARQLFNRANQLMPPAITGNSTYRNDFSPKSLVLEHPISYDVYCDRVCQYGGNRCAYAHQPGYQKFLDIYARLDYPLHTNEKPTNGINRRDHITLWDWFQVPKTKGTTVRIHLPPQRCTEEVRNGTVRPFAKNNFVPNRGLLTEHREHYRFH